MQIILQELLEQFEKMEYCGKKLWKKKTAGILLLVLNYFTIADIEARVPRPIFQVNTEGDIHSVMVNINVCG